MKRPLIISAALSSAAVALVIGAAPSQLSKLGQAKGLTLVDYYPGTNGVQRRRAVLTGSEFKLSTNNRVLLKDPRIENYREDGRLDWIASAPEATVDLVTHTASGTNNVVFRTADTNLYVSGVGFLWQPSNSVLILSNQTRTWIDKTAFTNTPAIL